MSGELSTSADSAKSAIDRLMFFTDAVVAIAMTILAIDLPVPDATSATDFFRFLGDHYGEFGAFFISFFVIASYWQGHHRFYRYVSDAPPTLVWANILWLLTVVLTPYATRVLWSGENVGDSDFLIRFALYAVVQALAAGAFLWATRVTTQEHLLVPDAPADMMAHIRLRMVVLIATFLLSVPFTLLVHAWAFLLWSFLPLWMSLALRLQARRAAA